MFNSVWHLKSKRKKRKNRNNNTPPAIVLLDKTSKCADIKCNEVLKPGTEGRWYGDKFYGEGCHDKPYKMTKNMLDKPSKGSVRQMTGIRPLKKAKKRKGGLKNKPDDALFNEDNRVMQKLLPPRLRGKTIRNEHLKHKSKS